MNGRIEIFVFGSNLQGRHGKGAALHARLYHGAITGQGEGFMGTCYAIPTKRTPYEILPIEAIRKNVTRFLIRAEHATEFNYRVTAIGCGLAGYNPEEIAPMFRKAFLTMPHVSLPAEFRNVLHLQQQAYNARHGL